MRVLPLAVVLIVVLTGPGAVAAPRHRNESPPTAQPDGTLVLPDTVPPPPTTAAPTHPVEVVAIGSTSATASSVPAQPVAGQSAASPPKPPVLARADQCLRAEAPRAAKADASTKLAVDLLLQDLCAAEVDRASLYARNIEALARFTPQSERTAAGLSGARVDPETGEIINPPAGDVAGAVAAAGFGGSDGVVPPSMRRLAVELVLAAKATPEPPKKTR